jgi:hypothetical protein
MKDTIIMIVIMVIVGDTSILMFILNHFNSERNFKEITQKDIQILKEVAIRNNRDIEDLIFKYNKIVNN